MAFRDVLPSRKPCCTKRRVTILEVLSCSNQSLDYLSTVWLWISAVNTSKIHYFGAQIGYVDRPAAMDRYDALEPTYCFEFIGMLWTCQIQVDISGHGLRERGLGNCSSKTSWSLPQCGHFNVLSVTGESSFSDCRIGRPDIIEAKIMELASVLTWWALDLCQIP